MGEISEYDKTPKKLKVVPKKSHNAMTVFTYSENNIKTEKTFCVII